MGGPGDAGMLLMPVGPGDMGMLLMPVGPGDVEMPLLRPRFHVFHVRSVPWKDFLEAALSHKAGFKVKPTDSVLVPDIDLMKRLGDMLEMLTPRDRANLLIWRMFIRFVNDFMKTGSEENDLQHDPFAQRCKLPTQSLRRENCICQVNTLFPEAHNDLLIGE